MQSDLRYIYWDACVFLSYVNGIPARMPILDTLLSRSSEGDGIAIFTSTLSIAEVAFAEQERSDSALDPSIEADIDALWHDRNAVKLIEFHEYIARDARDLMRQALGLSWSLKPYDANHLASAMRLNVSEFHTYDEKLHKYKDLTGFDILAPNDPNPRLFP